jgi:hypothetical protein
MGSERNLNYYPGVCLEGMRRPRKAPVSMVGVSTEFRFAYLPVDRLGGLVVRVLGYRSGGPGSIPGTARFSGGKEKGKQVVGLERGPLSLVSATEELLDRKVAAPV